MTAPEPTPTAEHIDAVARDLDAIEARFAEATADEVIYELWPTLVAEVRSLTESRATVAANLSASLMLAEAEVVTLRARLAAVEALADQWADRKRSDGMSGNAWIGLTLSGVAADLRAALATTGEAQR